MLGDGAGAADAAALLGEGTPQGIEVKAVVAEMVREVGGELGLDVESSAMAVVIQEIVQDKIYLDTSNEVKITGDLDDAVGLPDLDPNDL